MSNQSSSSPERKLAGRTRAEWLAYRDACTTMQRHAAHEAGQCAPSAQGAELAGSFLALADELRVRADQAGHSAATLARMDREQLASPSAPSPEPRCGNCGRIGCQPRDEDCSDQFDPEDEPGLDWAAHDLKHG